jgi:hypothetical protein
MTEATAAGGTTYPKVVAWLRDHGLPLSDISRVTQVKVRQVQHWLAGTSKPQGESLERLVDLNYLVERLANVYQPQGIEIWLHARNRALDGRRPIDMLEAGEFEPVIGLVEQLAQGVPG